MEREKIRKEVWQFMLSFPTHSLSLLNSSSISATATLSSLHWWIYIYFRADRFSDRMWWDTNENGKESGKMQSERIKMRKKFARLTLDQYLWANRILPSLLILSSPTLLLLLLLPRANIDTFEELFSQKINSTKRRFFEVKSLCARTSKLWQVKVLLFSSLFTRSTK